MRLKQVMTVVGISLLLFGFVCGIAAKVSAQDYSFKVHNTSKNNITKLMASEDKKNWSGFDIGTGIAPGKTETIVWSNSTNNQECKQYVKATFDDGTEAEPAKFDFCEKNLEIEF